MFDYKIQCFYPVESACLLVWFISPSARFMKNRSATISPNFSTFSGSYHVAIRHTGGIPIRPETWLPIRPHNPHTRKSEWPYRDPPVAYFLIIRKFQGGIFLRLRHVKSLICSILRKIRNAAQKFCTLKKGRLIFLVTLIGIPRTFSGVIMINLWSFLCTALLHSYVFYHLHLWTFQNPFRLRIQRFIYFWSF